MDMNELHRTKELHRTGQPVRRSRWAGIGGFVAGLLVAAAAFMLLPSRRLPAAGMAEPSAAAADRARAGAPKPAAGSAQPGTTPAAAPAATPGVVTLADPRQAAQIETIAAVEAGVPVSGALPARLAYDENATSRLAPPIDGRIVRLDKQIGDRVRAGEPIVVIDAPDLGQAIADATKAQADARLKSAGLARAEELFAGQVLARKDLESARAEAAQAQAELARAQLRLKNLNALGNARGQNFVLSSPIAGVITERNATLGQQWIASSGNPVVVVTDPARLALLIDVPEQIAQRLSVGMPIAFSVDAFPGEQFRATVTRIAPQVDPATRRVPVRAAVDNRDGRLKPEMFARAWPMEANGPQAVRVPASSLLALGAQTIAFVQRGERSYEQRTVDVAAQHADDAWLSAGVRPGERVVSAGALLLKAELDGQ